MVGILWKKIWLKKSFLINASDEQFHQNFFKKKLIINERTCFAHQKKSWVKIKSRAIWCAWIESQVILWKSQRSHLFVPDLLIGIFTSYTKNFLVPIEGDFFQFLSISVPHLRFLITTNKPCVYIENSLMTHLLYSSAHTKVAA